MNILHMTQPININQTKILHLQQELTWYSMARWREGIYKSSSK